MYLNKKDKNCTQGRPEVVRGPKQNFLCRTLSVILSIIHPVSQQQIPCFSLSVVSINLHHLINYWNLAENLELLG